MVRVADTNPLAGLMTVLTHSEGWNAYVKALEDMENRCLEKIASGSKEDFEFNKGFLMGVRACYHLPERLKQGS